MPEIRDFFRHLRLQKASLELLTSMRNKGREILFASPDSEEYRYLVAQRAEAAAGSTDMMHILMKPNPSKIAALEEFLHGTEEDWRHRSRG